LAGALLASQAGIGHPAAAPDGEKSLVAAGLALHVLGGAAWIGGLWPLGALLAEAKDDEHARPYAQFILERYSTMATIAVALVVIGAAIDFRQQFAGLGRLATNPWGWAILCKIALFGALIAIAYRNRFVLTPLFTTRPGPASKALLRNVVVDQGLGLAVLAAAAILGIVSPSG
jgi:putative copper resistance protein D